MNQYLYRAAITPAPGHSTAQRTESSSTAASTAQPDPGKRESATNETSPQDDLRLHLRVADGTTARGALPVLTRAVARTPLARWLYPHADVREDRLGALFSQLIDDTVSEGCVILAYQGSKAVGVALWKRCPGQDETGPAATALAGHLDDGRLAILGDQLARAIPANRTKTWSWPCFPSARASHRQRAGHRHHDHAGDAPMGPHRRSPTRATTPAGIPTRRADQAAGQRPTASGAVVNSCAPVAGR